MKLIDSHAHLTDRAFDADRAQVIERTLAAGVEKWIEIGCRTDEWETVIDFCKQYPDHATCALGMHPEYAHMYLPEDHRNLVEFLKDPHVVAVGEIGLDYYYLDQCPQNTQIRVFQQMISLANSVQKPIILHVRRDGEDYEPYEQTFTLLKRYFKPGPTLKKPGVLHCFSADFEIAKQALDQGLLLGVNGCFSYKQNEYIREAVKRAGAYNLVLETDCPYLSPQNRRGTRNDPSNIPLIAQYVADYLDMPVEKLAEITTQNAMDLYGLK